MTVVNNERTLIDHFRRTLEQILQINDINLNDTGLAVAYSGGLDSSVLLDLAKTFCQSQNIPLFAFHIHHGLSPNADDWLIHCSQKCASIGATFVGKKVVLENTNKDGVEASAREARYKSLGVLCAEYKLPLMLTAHHQDDQAETVLLQLLRGSGVAGLSGMDLFNRAPKLLCNDTLLMARPLLGNPRQTMVEYAAANAIAYVEDESNVDVRYVRNALRHQIMPILSSIAPGYAERLSRSATHAQSTNRLLMNIAKQDLDACKIENALDISRVVELGNDRIDNLLRFWLAEKGSRMPTTARLAELRHQLFEGRADARISVYHESLGIHRYKNKIYATSRDAIKIADVPPLQFKWSGESSIEFSDFGGTLHFEDADAGISADWLQAHILTIHARQGGERLKLALNRPSRDIKSHYQSLEIPFWDRDRLPFISHEGKLLFAAGIGVDARFLGDSPGQFISLRWEFVIQ
ncbi:tRNA lysidine(34) synthetase TilS [Undibacterium sp. Jales W-56]|uniref:tRNA lysidine(34) synthetase TilS n=1 Tax=Undibacterium sp. Jales W-56 TaxID=2897325 RepID=UPI0021D086FC|nr:tRNA lysidine(34) synthetase TilS [Undibacterium sp. Jales W-56]MCU6433190.1 tRNA lysidine(34) synthetase TilS [Undibacterium sp. Jales W-56]